MAAARRVLVPWQPGPLLDPDAVPARDGLDELVDELFPDVEGGPGLSDALLVVAGMALVAWGFVTDGGAGWLIAGATAFALGTILPARSGVRRLRARRVAHPQYQALDVTDPETLLLTRLYAELLAVAQPGGDLADRARGAAHGALVETASLLQGHAPVVAAERQYVAARVGAVQTLLAALRENPAQLGDAPRRSAIAEAKIELDALGGVGSVHALDALAQELRARQEP